MDKETIAKVELVGDELKVTNAGGSEGTIRLERIEEMLRFSRYLMSLWVFRDWVRIQRETAPQAQPDEPPSLLPIEAKIHKLGELFTGRVQVVRVHDALTDILRDLAEMDRSLDTWCDTLSKRLDAIECGIDSNRIPVTGQMDEKPATVWHDCKTNPPDTRRDVCLKFPDGCKTVAHYVYEAWYANQPADMSAPVVVPAGAKWAELVLPDWVD